MVDPAGIVECVRGVAFSADRVHGRGVLMFEQVGIVSRL
jgi:hypothetical protein